MLSIAAGGDQLLGAVSPVTGGGAAGGGAAGEDDDDGDNDDDDDDDDDDQVVCGVLTALILMTVTKLLYDYWNYRQRGKLPWIVYRMP